MDFVKLIQVTVTLLSNLPINLDEQTLSRKNDNIWWKIARMLDSRQDSFKLPTNIYMAWKRNSNQYRSLVMKKRNENNSSEEEDRLNEEVLTIQFTSEEVFSIKKYISIEKKGKEGRRK